MSRRRRHAVHVLGVALAALLLSGCDQFQADPIAFTRVDGVPVMRMCLPLTVSSVEVLTYVAADDYDGRRVWKAEGSAPIYEGAEFAVGEAPPGLTVTYGSSVATDVAASIGDRFAVKVEATDAYGPHRFFASLDAADFQHGGWVNGYGPVEHPCTLDPCAPGYACQNVWPQPSGPALRPTPTWTPGP